MSSFYLTQDPFSNYKIGEFMTSGITISPIFKIDELEPEAFTEALFEKKYMGRVGNTLHSKFLE